LWPFSVYARAGWGVIVDEQAGDDLVRATQGHNDAGGAGECGGGLELVDVLDHHGRFVCRAVAADGVDLMEDFAAEEAGNAGGRKAAGDHKRKEDGNESVLFLFLQGWLARGESGYFSSTDQ